MTSTTLPLASPSHGERIVQDLLEAYGDFEGFFIADQTSPNSRLTTTTVYLNPILCLWTETDGTFQRTTEKTIERLSDDGMAILDYIEEIIAHSSANAQSHPHLCAGFLSYELLHLIEPFKREWRSLPDTPLALFYVYQIVVQVDRSNRQVSVQNFSYEPQHSPFWEVEGLLSILSSQTIEQVPYQKAPANLLPSTTAVADFVAPHSNFTQPLYCKAVADIKERIVDGKVYQVNLSQQFRIPHSVSFRDYVKACRAIASAPQQAAGVYRYKGEIRSFVSASPELFLDTSPSDDISYIATMEPIKGTRPRHHDRAQDAQNATTLLSSEKDRAELAMIVDLVRNDLGKVALLGTIQVAAHAELRSFSRVHHLVSTVTALISKDTSLRELLSATFPCGSITGTPKIAAMKVIEDLEKLPRGIWTGAIGTIGAKRSCHFNVAIRTALLREDEIVFNAGGGVTIDSDPEEEYWETIIKSKVLVEGLLAATSKGSSSSPAISSFRR